MDVAGSGSDLFLATPCFSSRRIWQVEMRGLLLLATVVVLQASCDARSWGWIGSYGNQIRSWFKPTYDDEVPSWVGCLGKWDGGVSTIWAYIKHHHYR